MNEFLIAIHRDLGSKYPSPTPEQMKESVTEYKEWINGIAVQEKVLALPRKWGDGGRVISTAAKVNVGPYTNQPIQYNSKLITLCYPSIPGRPTSNSIQRPIKSSGSANCGAGK